MRLRQVLINLIGNAIKFTNHGKVEIGIETLASSKDDVTLRFSVNDTGIGISTLEQKIIFDSFSQADGSTTKRYGGTGLGLAISRQIVEQFGGNLEVTSTLGKGSTFVFTCKFNNCKTSNNNKTECKTPPLPLQEELPPGIRVLVVEDSAANRIVAKGLLEKLRCEVTLAVSGTEGIALFEKNDFDLVFMDISMPDMNGIEATKKFRESKLSPHNKTTPILALTAHALKGDKEYFLNSGLDDHITKPVTLKKLKEALQNHVKGVSAPKVSFRKAGKEPVIDFETGLSAALEAFGNNEEIFRFFSTSFLECYQEDMNSLRKALKNKNREDLKHVSHKLKGTISNFRIPELNQPIAMIENLSSLLAPINWNDMNVKITEFSSRLDLLIAELKRRLSR